MGANVSRTALIGVPAAAIATAAAFSLGLRRNRKSQQEDNKDVPKGRVLSISSTVVYGHVGNKSSTFPLQLLGFNVDPINSVQLSNHTGYDYFSGDRLEGAQLNELLKGLEKNGLLLTYTHLMTGYLGKQSFIEAVATLVGNLKKSNAELTYICDPVMGDDGKLYVPKSFIPIYKEKLIPLATMVTPNQSEAEWLSDMKIDSLDGAYKAASKLLEKGPKLVVITSLQLPGRETHIDAIAVSQCMGNNGKYYHLEIPRQAGKYSGCGDLTTALLLAWYHRHPTDVKAILENTFASIQHVIRQTRLYGVKRCKWTELELVNSKNAIEFPQPTCKATLRECKD
mmetsp:Transcript_11114/g.18111  ORF Transcript_11114/g.18111 Transcript_11114/m.18111 type:complete len:340 (-) Transcript_11114:310-1329(-)|eukprot:jgi/Bigna1/70565/fgenesh1_pg.12_\